MTPKPYRRRRRIIKPRLQLKLIGAFVGVSLLGYLLQYLLLARELSSFAQTLPTDGARLLASTPGLLASVLAVSFGVLFPLTLVVGILVTFRVAGPIYRFESYLGEIARGESNGAPCRIRKGDELNELCDAINDAVAAMRADAAPPATPSGDAESGPGSDTGSDADAETPLRRAG